MDFLFFNRRRILPAGVLFAGMLAATGLRAQTPDASPTPSIQPKYAALQNELALYSPLESPWADLKINHAVESHLFNLMRAEARLWALQDRLAAQGGPTGEEAAENLAHHPRAGVERGGRGVAAASEIAEQTVRAIARFTSWKLTRTSGRKKVRRNCCRACTS